MTDAEFELPDTRSGADNVYFDGQAISWDFSFDGKRATFGRILSEFDQEFPVATGGERITLHEPAEGAELHIVTLDDEGNERPDQEFTLNEDRKTAYIPGDRNMRVQTGKLAVEYICIYPGQPAEE